MRQALPTYPLTSANRNGGFLAVHCRYMVSALHGAKHSGLYPGPGTTLGPLLSSAGGAAGFASSALVAGAGASASFWQPTTALITSAPVTTHSCLFSMGRSFQ